MTGYSFCLENIEKILRNVPLVDGIDIAYNEEFQKIVSKYHPHDQQADIDIDIKLLNEFGISNYYEICGTLSELAINSDDFSSDIPSLKKRIKYCKNPLERKSLERQLNAAYKEIKKRR